MIIEISPPKLWHKLGWIFKITKQAWKTYDPNKLPYLLQRPTYYFTREEAQALFEDVWDGYYAEALRLREEQKARYTPKIIANTVTAPKDTH